MNSDYYEVLVEDILVADHVSLNYAAIFLKAIFEEYYKEPSLKVSIKKMDNTVMGVE